MTDPRVLRFRRDLDLGLLAPTAGWRVRRLDLATDAAAVTALVAAVGTDGDVQVRPEGIMGELADRPGRRVRVWLAEDHGGGAAVGIVTLVSAGPRHSLGWLLVAPAFRRRGVATRLVGEALAAARAAGGREVWVETHRRWPAAVALWRGLGFEPA